MTNQNQFPLTYSLFVKWFKIQSNFCEQDESDLQTFLDLEYVENSWLFGSNSFFKNFTYFNRGSLIEFLDEQGLLIEISVDYTRAGIGERKPLFSWTVRDWNIGEFCYEFTNTYQDGFLCRNRNEAYLCAVNKSFEILENKLKND